jgi:hypothetical protein
MTKLLIYVAVIQKIEMQQMTEHLLGGQKEMNANTKAMQEKWTPALKQCEKGWRGR